MKPIAYALVAVVAATAGFVVYRHGMAPAAQLEHTAPDVAASEGVSTAVATDESPVATELPDFSLHDRDGKLTSIRSWPGKSMIVNFWATWCAPCRREIPLLQEIQKTHGAAGVQVVGVAVDFRDDVLKYSKEIGIGYPVLIGEEDGYQAINSFGLGSLGLPFTVFTDNQGRIVLTHLGELTKPESVVMLDVVQRVNKGELTPAAARSVAARQLEKTGAAQPASPPG
ncbi:MAG TPA: TlpA disulfide reductase family protein [Povalibacter sp.]